MHVAPRSSQPCAPEQLVLAAQAQADEAYRICPLALVVTSHPNRVTSKRAVPRAGVKASRAAVEEALGLNQQASVTLAAAFELDPRLRRDGSAVGMQNRIRTQAALLAELLGASMPPLKQFSQACREYKHLQFCVTQ